MKDKPAAIIQELESDDELPGTYNDVAILPAYLDDNRFNQINFPWLNNVNPSSEVSQSQSTHDHRDEILRHEGILKGQDLYCLKSMESLTCSSTLIWFLNFLLYKDLHSQYSYLKSCLVNDLTSTIPLTKRNNLLNDNIVKKRFEILVKL